jgi:hypothetical protein
LRAVCAAALILGFLSMPGASRAQDFAIAEVASVTALPLEQLKPRTIAVNDHRNDPLADAGTGLIRFEDWMRARPLQKQLLSLYPSYQEPLLRATVGGVSKVLTEKLHMYVAEARFLVGRPAAGLNLARLTTVQFLERLDPAIKHQAIAPADARPLKNPDIPFQRHPARDWCNTAVQTACIQSRYKFEGRLPAAITLANKLREGSRPVADHIEFQNELRLLAPTEADAANLMKLTGVNTPVAAVLEQNIFWVNQIMQFGKFLAVFQPHPADPARTVVSAFMALAVKTDVLAMKKEYETVPVLRNLVPAQVLVGNSSFNTGNSLSAGLPVYVRNRIKTIAMVLEKE